MKSTKMNLFALLCMMLLSFSVHAQKNDLKPVTIDDPVAPYPPGTQCNDIPRFRFQVNQIFSYSGPTAGARIALQIKIDELEAAAKARVANYCSGGECPTLACKSRVDIKVNPKILQTQFGPNGTRVRYRAKITLYVRGSCGC
ncbi:MAG: hypothetical protein AAF570_08585 [Bacteroidota bacterium]